MEDEKSSNDNKIMEGKTRTQRREKFCSHRAPSYCRRENAIEYFNNGVEKVFPSSEHDKGKLTSNYTIFVNYP